MVEAVMAEEAAGADAPTDRAADTARRGVEGAQRGGDGAMGSGDLGKMVEGSRQPTVPAGAGVMDIHADRKTALGNPFEMFDTRGRRNDRPRKAVVEACEMVRRGRTFKTWGRRIVVVGDFRPH